MGKLNEKDKQKLNKAIGLKSRKLKKPKMSYDEHKSSDAKTKG